MKRRQLVLVAAKSIVGVALLVALVVFVRPAEVVRVAAQVRISWLLAAVALLPLNLFLEVEVWRPVLRLVAPTIGRSQVIRAVLAGFTLGLVTPANVGDFFGRAMLIPTDRKWETGVSAAAVRLPELLWMIVVGLAGLAFLKDFVAAPVSWLVPVVLGLGVGVAAILSVLCFAPSGSIRRLDPVFARFRVWRHVRFIERIPASTIVSVFALAGLRYLVFSLQFLCCLYAFGSIGVAPFMLVASVAATFLLRALIPSITLANMGVREGIAVFFLGMVGVPSALALNGAFMLFVINVGTPAILGLPFVLRGNMRPPSADAVMDGETSTQTPAIGLGKSARHQGAKNLLKKPDENLAGHSEHA